MWWSVTALTTVGYGDVYPITRPGKLIASVVAFVGIGFFALPAGIIGSGFVEVMMEAKQERDTLCDESTRSSYSRRSSVGHHRDEPNASAPTHQDFAAGASTPFSARRCWTSALDRDGIARQAAGAKHQHSGDERERLVLRHAAKAIRDGDSKLALLLLEQRLELIGG